MVAMGGVKICIAGDEIIHGKAFPEAAASCREFHGMVAALRMDIDDFPHQRFRLVVPVGTVENGDGMSDDCFSDFQILFSFCAISCIGIRKVPPCSAGLLLRKGNRCFR